MSFRSKPRGENTSVATQGRGSRGRLGDGAGGRPVGELSSHLGVHSPGLSQPAAPLPGGRTPARGLPVPSGLWGTAPGGEQGGSVCGNRGLAAWEALSIAEH